MSEQPDTGEASTTAPVGLGPDPMPDGGPDTRPVDDDLVPAAGPDPQPAAVPAAVPAGPQQVSLRRAPRYRAFVLTGAVIGVVLSLALVRFFPDDGQYSTGTVLGYLAAVLGLGGGVLGAALALLVERPRR